VTINGRGVQSLMADVPGLTKLPVVAIVACANSVWRLHGTTAEVHRPEPKGEGTVWWRKLIRPNRTQPQSDQIERGYCLVNQPGVAGHESEVMKGPVSRMT
jgi:hypothetical protein